MRISAGRSGIRILRFTSFERFAHWLTAVSFVVLGLTGLNITFGKVLLRPLIGPEAFSAFSQYAKYAHNYLSFSFVFGLAIIIAMWMKDNIPEKADIEWFRQGGGFVKSRHAPARRFNAGEKLVYWLAFGAGAAVAVSGYLLMFPFYVTNIFGMQIAQAVHGIVALLFVALILGHIYIGTLGMEGAFEAMGTGEVDLNWAKEHHDLWLEDQIAKGQAKTSPDTSRACHESLSCRLRRAHGDRRLRRRRARPCQQAGRRSVHVRTERQIQPVNPFRVACERIARRLMTAAQTPRFLFL